MEYRGTNAHISVRSILAATDFSAHSESVLSHATAIARRYRAKLRVVHVIPTNVYKAVPAEVMDEALKQTRSYVQDSPVAVGIFQGSTE